MLPFEIEENFRIQDVTSKMAQGDEAAFQSFHDHYCDRVFRYLLVLTRGDEGLSRELLQISFIKLVQGIESFTDEKACWNWVGAMTRTAFNDYVREAGGSPSMLLLEDEYPAERFFNEDPLLKLLCDTLEELDPVERLLIEDVYHYRESYRNLAEKGETTPKAIEARLASVRQKLRQGILERCKSNESI